jgi:hypothetical protein
VETVKKLNEKHWQILNENQIHGGYLCTYKKWPNQKKKNSNIVQLLEVIIP